MSHITKLMMKTAVISAIFMMTATPVFAEGLTVSADKESCEIGDKVTVTIEADTGDVPPDISVEFNSNRLNFESCSAEYGGGGGGLVTFKEKSATVEFTTLSGGNAEVSVTAAGDDGNETQSVSVSVNGEDTAGDAEAAVSSTGVTAGTIDIGEGRVIQTVFAEEYKPVLFHKETIEYNGQTVECAKFDMGDIVFLYTTDPNGDDGKFMIYDQTLNELNEVRMIQGIENRFIIVLPDCDGELPEGYTKAVLDWNGQPLTAFLEEGVAAGTAVSQSGIDPADFFLLYAMSSEGNKGWYRYDKNEGTYQRADVAVKPAGEEDSEEDASEEERTPGILDEYIPGNIQSILIIVCAPLALILLIVVIILAVKLHEYEEDYEDYYGDAEDDEDEEEEEEIYTRRPAAKGAVTAASLVGRSMSETDEDDGDEEDEEDDEEDDGYPAEDDEEDDGYPEDEDDEEEEEEEEEDPYDRPLTRREQRELAREEKWRKKEEKKAAKRRAQGYEEATPFDWSSFEKNRDEDDEDIKTYRKSKPPKYMTESLEPVEEPDEDEEEEQVKKAPLPPRKKVVRPEETQMPHVLQEEEQREKQRRLFEQQQRIEEQRRIEKEQQEAQNLKDQQQFIASKTEDDDLDEDFQFEFLNL